MLYNKFMGAASSIEMSKLHIAEYEKTTRLFNEPRSGKDSIRTQLENTQHLLGIYKKRLKSSVQDINEMTMLAVKRSLRLQDLEKQLTDKYRKEKQKTRRLWGAYCNLKYDNLFFKHRTSYLFDIGATMIFLFQIVRSLQNWKKEFREFKLSAPESWDITRKYNKMMISKAMKDL